MRDKAGGESARLQRADARSASIVIRAPKTARKVETWQDPPYQCCQAEAEAEIRGEPVRKPTAGGAVSKPKSINERLGSMLSSANVISSERSDLPPGKTKPRDAIARANEIKGAMDDVIKVIKRDYS